ncbi:MAG: hypothetical protein MJ072_01275, partial [Clostridia bacterium]|nr:hypothetical protein [Clostridia bacterium]
MINKTLKLLTALLVVALSVGSLAACTVNSNGTTDVTLKTPGDLIANCGAYSETQNYFYFINGTESYNANSAYGVPATGALWVADKNFTKAEIVVTKLMSAEDKNAGVFVYGDYVYYGTTNIEKNTSGEIDYEIVEFQKAKLDGSGVERILLKSGMDTEFRFVIGADEVVYLLYIDKTEESTDVIAVNTETKASTTVATGVTEYAFSDVKTGAGVSVLYTHTVLKYPDVKDNTETESYNELFAYVAGEEVSDAELSGKTDNVTYSITDVIDGCAYITETYGATILEARTYAVALADVKAGNYETAKQQVINTDHIANSVIKSLSEIYYVDGDGLLVKGSLLDKKTKTVAPSTVDADVLLGTYTLGGVEYMFYVDCDYKINAVELNATNPADKIYVIVDGTVATSGFPIGFENGYIVYQDNSATGCGYMYCIDLSAVDFTTDLNEETEGEVTTYTLKSEKIHLLGVKTDADFAAIFDAHFSEFRTTAFNSSTMKLEIRYTGSEEGHEADFGELVKDGDGKLVLKGYAEIKAEYDALTDGQKALVSEENTKYFERFTKAMEINNDLAVLESDKDHGFIEDVGVWTIHTEEEWRNIYNTVKGVMDGIASTDGYKDLLDLLDHSGAAGFLACDVHLADRRLHLAQQTNRKSTFLFEPGIDHPRHGHVLPDEFGILGRQRFTRRNIEGRLGRILAFQLDGD